MIFIDRNKEPVPKVLTGSTSRGGRETTRAVNHYTSVNRNKSFNFSVYRDKEVKETLIKLFNEKCAYCESKFLHVYSGDIEHFRPKGEITGASPKKPGYYWLAADWDNLLLSCRNCNQKLKHEIHSVSGKKTMGKMNQFPLSDNSKRVRNHTGTDIKAEEPYRLLINPCLDDPEEHFEYDREHGVIKPKTINGSPSEKGKTSIEVYVLQRVPLVLAREKVLIRILAQIQRVKEAVQNVNNNLESDSDVQFYFDKILKRELRILKEFMEPAEEFSAMAKQIIGGFMKENFGIEL